MLLLRCHTHTLCSLFRIAFLPFSLLKKSIYESAFPGPAFSQILVADLLVFVLNSSEKGDSVALLCDIIFCLQCCALTIAVILCYVSYAVIDR